MKKKKSFLEPRATRRSHTRRQAKFLMTIKIKNPSCAVIEQFGMDMRIEINKAVEKTFAHAVEFLTSEKTSGKKTFVCQPLRVTVEKPRLSPRKKNKRARKRKQK